MTTIDIGIQWKGTDACLDMHCICGDSHFDGYFAYFLKCGRCGRLYHLNTTVKASLIEDHRVAPDAQQTHDEGF